MNCQRTVIKEKNRYFFLPLSSLSVPLIATLILNAFPIPATAQERNLTIAANYACFRGASAGYLTPRLHVGMAGRSIHVGDLNLRQRPGVGSRVVGILPPGSRFTVLAGPACADSYVWWRVNTGRGRGWVAEGEPTSSVYWLKPL